MGMKKETRFKTGTVAPFLKALPNTWFVKTQQRAIRGTPDYLLCVNGMFVGMELKKDGKEKPDPLQQYNLGRIKASKGIALVAHPENWEKVSRVLTILANDASIKRGESDDH